MGGFPVEFHIQSVSATGAQTQGREGLSGKARAGLGHNAEICVVKQSVLDERVGAQTEGALLHGDEAGLDLAPEHGVLLPEVGQRHHQRGTARFHIQCAHPVQPVTLHSAGGGPGPAVADLDGVQMAVQADHRPVSDAVQLQPDIFAMEPCDLVVRVGVQPGREPLPAHPLHGVGHDLVLLKVGALDFDQIPQQLAGLLLLNHDCTSGCFSALKMNRPVTA